MDLYVNRRLDIYCSPTDVQFSSADAALDEKSAKTQATRSCLQKEKLIVIFLLQRYC